MSYHALCQIGEAASLRGFSIAPDGSKSAGLVQYDRSPGFPGQSGLSQDQITSMIQAGTQRLKENIEQEGDAWDAPTIYTALRFYNSGSVDTSNMSNGMGATDSYVSDVANRFLVFKDRGAKFLARTEPYSRISVVALKTCWF